MHGLFLWQTFYSKFHGQPKVQPKKNELLSPVCVSTYWNKKQYFAYLQHPESFSQLQAPVFLETQQDTFKTLFCTAVMQLLHKYFSYEKNVAAEKGIKQVVLTWLFQ